MDRDKNRDSYQLQQSESTLFRYFHLSIVPPESQGYAERAPRSLVGTTESHDGIPSSLRVREIRNVTNVLAANKAKARACKRHKARTHM